MEMFVMLHALPFLSTFCYNRHVDERAFIQEKQQSWEELSQSLDLVRAREVGALSREQIESLGSGYRAVVSDLAFARSQGASDNLITHLNNLAGRAHGVLYASESARFKGVFNFLLRDFPTLFRSTFKYTLISMLLFITGWMVALYLIYTIPDIHRNLIPKELTAHKSESRSDMSDTLPFAIAPAEISSYIMTNNIKQGIYAFAGGVTFGVLSVITIFWNGLAIGALITIATNSRDVLLLLSLLLPHGFIELTAIFICGGAGLLTGSAMIAPGNLRRTDAIRISGSKALKLFAGTVPFFIVAAIIEGFITPSVLPIIAKLAFSALTLIGLVLYLGFAGSTQWEGEAPAEP
jgi:uncharacterized membrane protein SpoIIM required for sporulation